MKKFNKILIGGAFIFGFLVTLNSKQVLATSVDTIIDVTPPRGIVKVEGATLKDGVYYTGETNITLDIEVADDYTASENIKMIVSDGPIQGEYATNDDNWESYTPTKNWTLKNLSEENLIYLYLKDESNNISPNIIIDASSTYTITYSGEGENMPEPKTAQFGMLFNVSIKEPYLEGKYFIRLE